MEEIIKTDKQIKETGVGQQQQKKAYICVTNQYRSILRKLKNCLQVTINNPLH